MIRWLAIVFFLGISIPGVAHEARDCQHLLIGSFEALVKYGLEQRLITTTELTDIIESERPKNPMSKNGLSAEAAKLRAAFEKLVANMPLSEWQFVKGRLSDLVEHKKTDESHSSKARELTRRVLAPKLIYKSRELSGGIHKMTWQDSDPLTLLVEVYRSAYAKVESRDGIKIELIGHPKGRQYEQNREEEKQKEILDKIRSKFPKLDAREVIYLVELQPDLKLALAPRRSGQRQDPEAFLIKGDEPLHVGQISGITSIHTCVFVPPSFVDCVVGRGPIETYVRLDPNDTTKLVDLNFSLTKWPANLSLTHLKGGIPLVASSHGSQGIEIFKPLESPRAFQSVSVESKSVAWINANGLDIYLAATADSHDVLFEPLVDLTPRAKLPLGFAEGRILAFDADYGQVYAVSNSFDRFLTIKLYGEVGR